MHIQGSFKKEMKTKQNKNKKIYICIRSTKSDHPVKMSPTQSAVDV